MQWFRFRAECYFLDLTGSLSVALAVAFVASLFFSHSWLSITLAAAWVAMLLGALYLGRND